ncbi:NTPase [Kitasatospora sp. HPMI-4]|uniref:NTPase n=1 Tax=Kitasatospora sp. HPMI-4 TaxID=3448443 RepID=UPI003F1AAC15
MPMRILLEGRPGVGKTTVLRRLAALLGPRGAVGFTTEEIRQGGTRVGFTLETLTGEREVLAHVDFPGPPRVGRYGVDTDVMERLAVPCLEQASKARSPRPLVLVDELGRMELSSVAFRDAVRALFEADADVVATVHAHHDPFTDALRRRADVELIQVTPANRERLAQELAAVLSDR